MGSRPKTGREIRSRQGDSIDALCWRIYGRTEGVVELVLEANPGLANLGVILPENTFVFCPVASVRQPAGDTTLKLWD